MSLIVKIGADTRAFDREMRKLTSDVKTISKKFESVGKSLTSHVTVPLALAGGAVIKLGSDFEASMSKLVTISGATGKDVESLTNKAIEMGTSTQYSATQAADALTELAKSGMNSTQAMDAIPGVLAMAAVEGMELARAAEITSAVMNGFNMEAGEATKIANVLAKNSNMSATGIEEIGAAMKPVAGFASELGLEFEDVNSAIGIMANNGIQGAVAGQKLNSILRSLVAPSKQASSKMKELGINVFDANGKMKALPEIIGIISDKTKGMGDQQKLAALKVMFGADAMAGLLPLLKEGESGLSDYSAELKNSEGYASDAAAAMNDNLKGSFIALKSAAETAAISLYKNIGPALKKIVEGVTEMVKSFANMSPAGQKALLTFAAIAMSIGPLLIVIAKVIMVVGKVKAAFSLAAKATGLFSKASMLVGGPAGLIVIAIIAIITAVTLLIVYWDDIKEVTIKVWTAISSFFSTIGESISSTISSVWEGIKESTISIWNSISDFFSGIGDSIGGALSGAWNGIVEVTTNVWNGIKDFFSEWGKTILIILGGPIAWLIASIISNWDIIKEVTTNVWNGIKDFFISVWEGIRSFFEPFINGIVTLIETCWNTISTITSAVWGFISQYLQALWTALLYFVQPIFESISTFISEVWTKVKSKAEEVWNAIKTNLINIWNGIKEVATNVWNGIKDFFASIWNTITTVATAAWNGISSFFTTIWNGIKEIAIVVWTAISSFFTTTWNGIKSVAGTIWNSISSFFTTTWNGIKTTATDIWGKIVGAIKGPIEAVKTWISTTFTAISNSISSVWNNIRTSTSTVWNGIRSTIVGIVDGIKNAVGNAFNGMKSIAVNAWEGIKSGIRNVINGIIVIINKFISGFNAPAKALNKIPGVSAPTISSIPMLATGGTVFGSGSAIVGEAGPELIQKSGSSVKVTPLSANEKAGGIGGAMGGGGGIIEVPVSLDGEVIARVVAPLIDSQLRNKRDSKMRAQGGW